MQLAELIAATPGVDAPAPSDLELSGIQVDSRQVGTGDLFVAIRGTADDGHKYLPQAVAAGAAAAVGEQPDPGLGIPYIQVENSRLAYANLAAAWFDHPGRQLTMIGITGTDGKTTTAMQLFEIMQRAGLAAGLISTVQAQIGDESVDTGLHVTTPDPMDLQRLLSDMVRAGLTHCVLEATSHGLAQHRVAGCEFDIGVVTNITHEHLDFHGSYEAYREAKGRLFAGLSEADSTAGGPPKPGGPDRPGVPDKPGRPDRLAVLNRDDDSYEYLHEVTQVRQVSYGFHPEADLRGERLAAGRGGIELLIRVGERELPVRSPLLGGYNASNIMAAMAAAVFGLRVSPEHAAAAVAAFDGVPGRMQPIELGQPFAVLVDFAHTPEALRAALETARRLTEGRVISVFGSAGLRDRAKRRMMAEISAELADLSVLTAEDPRTEPLEGILAEMAEGARAVGGREGVSFHRVPDRGRAIRTALEQARAGDLVIICGKGHEQSMCFGETEYPWDDRVAARAALAEHLGVEGPTMPELPTSSP